MLRRISFALLALLLLTSFFALAQPATPDTDAGSADVRIGVYDSRAIAVAYAASSFNPVGDRMREYEDARAAGDDRRVRELEAWGERHQRQLHRQGFATVPVTDLLGHVKKQLPEVARAADVVAIARACDYIAPDVEAVDVTDALVQLYNPSAKTLKTIAQLRKQSPVSLDELDHNH